MRNYLRTALADYRSRFSVKIFRGYSRSGDKRNDGSGHFRKIVDHLGLGPLSEIAQNVKLPRCISSVRCMNRARFIFQKINKNVAVWRAIGLLWILRVSRLSHRRKSFNGLETPRAISWQTIAILFRYAAVRYLSSYFAWVMWYSQNTMVDLVYSALL